MEAEAMTKRPQLELPQQDEANPSPQRRPSAGPRTELGKERSKINAVKYGIFSRILLIGSESKHEFDSLLSGLREGLQPVGTLEEVLVDQLAASYWRYRRLLIAERAEIARENPPEDLKDQDLGDAIRKRLLPSFGQGSLRTAFLNRSLTDLLDALICLKEVRDKIRAEGLCWERDRVALEDAFGRLDGLENRLVGEYRAVGDRAHDDDGAAVLTAKRIVEEIENLLKLLDEVSKSWIEKNDLDRDQRRAAALIPKPAVAERLLRYQVTLERSIERTLTQLERLQRMRQGQPVAPPIKVQI